MKLFGYFCGQCDPIRDIGFARAYSKADELDKDLFLFCKTMITARELRLKQWRVFVTNDDVTFDEVDHFVLFDEPMDIVSGPPRIREIDLNAAWQAAQDDGA